MAAKPRSREAAKRIGGDWGQPRSLSWRLGGILMPR
jgi:hypothetical protein